MSTCKSCGAPVWFAKVSPTKTMIVDREPSPDGNIELLVPVRLGNDITCRVIPKAERDRVLIKHKSHFATCPNAAQHRKPR
jgi:hypothetical protein